MTALSDLNAIRQRIYDNEPVSAEEMRDVLLSLRNQRKQSTRDREDGSKKPAGPTLDLSAFLSKAAGETTDDDTPPLPNPFAS